MRSRPARRALLFPHVVVDGYLFLFVSITCNSEGVSADYSEGVSASEDEAVRAFQREVNR